VENPQAKGQQEGNSPFAYVAQRSYGRCGGRVHGRMNLYLLSVWDPANFSCARISDKVPGKLGGASTGDTRLLQNLPGIMLPEAKFAQASRVRASIQNSPAEAESFRNRQITCSEFASVQIFHPQISTCHPRFMFT